MRKFQCFVFLSVLALMFTTCQSDIQESSWHTEDGYIPDSTTAAAIAEVIFVRVYGKKVLKTKPFKVRLENKNIWTVEGTLQSNKHGRVPYLEMQKADGKILKVIHGK